MLEPVQNSSSAARVRPPGLAAILCADWGKENHKRAVYLADIAGRSVRRVEGTDWSVPTVTAAAERWKSGGTVLVTFDAPLGVPASFLTAAAQCRPLHPMTTFLELLEWTRSRVTCPD